MFTSASGLVKERNLYERRPHLILILEDDPVVASGVTALLELEDVEVSLATTLAEAGRKLADSNPDALILDVSLPDGNGIDFYRGLLRSGRRFPAVFVSGHADERLVDGLHSAMVAFLRKPFEFADLWSAVLSVVAQQG
jgi:DNA-binding response OmpR family regulator